jgi:hypothetical protein
MFKKLANMPINLPINREWLGERWDYSLSVIYHLGRYTCLKADILPDLSWILPLAVIWLPIYLSDKRFVGQYQYDLHEFNFIS